MRIMDFYLARAIVAGIVCCSWPLSVCGQEPVIVRYVSGPDMAGVEVFASDSFTIPTATFLQPNTGTPQSTFHFEEDLPLSQLTLTTAPEMGETEGERYLPEFDKEAPRTLVVIQDYAPSGSGGGTRRPWTSQLYAWDAPNFFHRPLYFEQPNLERYGHYRKGWRLQSAISTAHFFAAVPAWPLKVCIDKPCERVYTLGHFRPGNCNPHYHHKLK